MDTRPTSKPRATGGPHALGSFWQTTWNAAWVLLLLASGSLAEEIYTWRSFTREDGLASNGVRDVYEARDGRVWAACYGGLSVYDGHQWETLRSIVTVEGSSVSFDRVTCIAESASDQAGLGRIWIGTEDSGVVFLEGSTSTWHLLRTPEDLTLDDVTAILVASDGTLWFGTEGRVVTRTRIGEWTVHDEIELLGHPVYQITEDYEAGVWVTGYDFGAYRYGRVDDANVSGERPLWTRYDVQGKTIFDGTEGGRTEAPGSSSWLTNDYVYSVTPHRNGDVTFATIGGGAARLEGNQFRITESYLVNPNVTGVTEGPGGELWYSTFDGISRQTPSGAWDSFRAGTHFKNGFFRRVVFGERSRIVWFASLGGGLVAYMPTGFHKVNELDARWVLGEVPPEDEEENFDIRGGLTVTREGVVWGATQRSVFFVEENAGIAKFGLSQMQFDDADDPKLQLTCIQAHRETDTIWVGSTRGLRLWHASTGWRRMSPPATICPKDFYVWDIYIDGDSRVWLATRNEGAIVYDEDGTWSSLPPNVLPSSTVFSILQDKEGDLWFGTLGGVARRRMLSPEDVAWDQFRTSDGLSMNRVYSIQQSDDGTMWFGGLRAVDKWKDGRFERTTFQNSQNQIEDGIYCFRIVKTEDGSLWFAIVGLGVVRYKDDLWTTYRSPDGLLGSTVRGVAETDNALWIATATGLVRYQPESDAPTVFFPEHDNPTVFAAGTAPIFRVHGQDRFARTPSDELRFAWRIDGGKWQEPQLPPIIVSGISRGSHVMEVQAIDRDLNRSPIAKHEFVVLGFWWQNPGVAILTIGILLGMVVVYVLTRQLIEKRRSVLEAARTVSEAVVRPTSVPKEKTRTEIAMSTPDASHSGEFSLGSLDRYHKVLQGLGEPQRGIRISELCSKLLDEYRRVLEPRIELDLFVDRDEPRLSVDPEGIALAMDHLIRNAIEALGESPKGFVRVSILRSPRSLLRKPRLVLRVEDDGPGIPTSVRKRVGTPFNSAGSKRRMGLGLFHAWEVARAHQGTLNIVSRRGGGSIVEIVLPLPA